MKRFIPAILFAIAIVPVIGILAALTWFTNEWVISTLVTVTLLAWLCGWLVIAYGRGRARAAAIGAVVAGAAYWLLALGPWFQMNVGSTLLTSRFLSWIEMTHRQPVQPAAPTAVFTTLDMNSGGYVAANTVLTGSGVVSTSPQYVVTTIPPGVPSPPAMSLFQATGHWSFVWLCALAGGALAAYLQRRRAPDAEKQEAAP